MEGADAVDRENGESRGRVNGDSTQSEPFTTAIENVAFPVSRRGYDREAVDGYVSRVREVVARLEASRSPEAAVKEALEKVGEQTKSVLQSAGQSAEQITDAARREADETEARAKGEAEEAVSKAQAEAKETVETARKQASEHLRRTQEEVTARQEEAEARLRELRTDTESIRQERSELLDEIRGFAARVEEVAQAADARFPERGAVDTGDEGSPEPETAEEGDTAIVTAADEPAE